MVIIETKEDFDAFRQAIKGKSIIVIPWWSDPNVHVTASNICLFAVEVDGEQYIIPFRHNDAVRLIDNFIKAHDIGNWECSIYTPDKKILMMAHFNFDFDKPDIFDINNIEYSKSGNITNKEDFYTPNMKEMYRKFRDQKNINEAIPMMDLITFFERYFDHLRQFLHPKYLNGFYHFIIAPTLAKIEMAGLGVDVEKFSKRFPKNIGDITYRFSTPLLRNSHNLLVYASNVVNTEYNPYNITGRITNSFNGINYAALGTKDGTRNIFVSRFSNSDGKYKGSLVSIDYSSFHPMIIANEINYKFTMPVYRQFAMEFYKTIDPTDDEIKKAKLHTMELMYDVEQKTNIEFFDKMYEFRKKLWATIQKEGILYTPDGNVLPLARIQEPSEAKVFNYYIQMREMEVSVRSIWAVIKYLTEKEANSQVVLYTYDSILIDFYHKDGPDVLREVVNIMEHDGIYPVKVEYGDNYGEMKSATHLIKKTLSKLA